MSPRPSAPARRLPPHSGGSRGAWRSSQLRKSSESMPSAAFLHVLRLHRSRAAGHRVELRRPREPSARITQSNGAATCQRPLEALVIRWRSLLIMEWPVNPSSPTLDTANRRWRASGTVWQSGGSSVEPGLGMRSNRPFRKHAKTPASAPLPHGSRCSPPDTASQPPASSFAVSVGGTARTVDAVAVSGKVVTLTLLSAVTSGQTVTVGYTVPTGADAKPVQDAAGNRAASFANTGAKNPTAAALPAVLSPSTDHVCAPRRVTANEAARTASATLSPGEAPRARPAAR